MIFECPKCKSWNTYTKDSYLEGSEGCCFNCHTFYKMGKPKLDKENIIIFLLVLSIIGTIAYFLGVFN